MSTTATTLTQDPNPTTAAPPQDWRSALPEDLRAEKTFESFKDLPSLAKSFIETKKMVGDAIRLPKADAPDEEWSKLFTRLGRPEAPDKYTFQRPEMPNGLKYDEELETAFKGMAHKAGLLPRQAQQLLQEYTKMQADRVVNYTKEMDTGVAALKKEWGTKFDSQVGLAQRAVKEVGGQEVIDLLDATGLGNHPTMIKFFANIGAQMGETTPLVVGDETNTQDGKESVQAKINAIRANKEHAYNNPRATYQEHEAALKEMAKLYEQLAKFDPETVQEG